MPIQLTDKALTLIANPKNFAHVATVLSDGSPHLTPIWIDADREHVYLNSADGRLKVENLRRDPRVAIEVSDHENPYSYVAVRGRAELTHDGADEHINELSKKYLGQDEYPMRKPGEVRVKIIITPDHVSDYPKE